ncbi:MAG: lipopolysaccharide biosynthesis protein [Chloroflexota bacterium]|nr:lipopolysaccharide biosynthesis protein [Chloroflexota bacterium]
MLADKLDHEIDEEAPKPLVPSGSGDDTGGRGGSLGKQAAQGAAWNYAAFLVSKGLLFVATLVLARLLTPAEFGLVGMALLVITALDVLRDFGIGAAVIYHQREPQAAANMAFALSSGIGILLFAANWLLAPFTAHFFKTANPADTQTVVSLLQVLGFSLLFASLGSTHDALLQKEINYRRRMVPEVSRTLFKGVISVALAFMGWGVWSLVIGQVVGEASATLLLWYVARWRPTLQISRALLRPILGYGVQTMFAGGLGTLISDVDYLIIGRLLGETPLGLYTLAFRIPELIIKNLSQAVSSVAFPVAARLQSDRDAMRDAYLSMQHYMLAILAPLGLGLYAVTPALIHLLFQSKWDPIIPVMQALSLYMVMGAINHWPGVIYKAVGRPDILNRLSLVKLAMLVPVLWWCALSYGIEGVAWGQVVVRAIGVVIDMYAVSRFVKLSVWENLKVIWPPFVAALVMLAGVYLVFLLDPGQRSLPVAALAIAFGALLYGAGLWLVDRKAVVTLLALGRSLTGRDRPVAAQP